MQTNDTFRLLTEEQAGALLGAIVSALVAYDFYNRIVERFFS